MSELLGSFAVSIYLPIHLLSCPPYDIHLHYRPAKQTNKQTRASAAAVVAQNASPPGLVDECCAAAVRLFLRLLGTEAANLALRSESHSANHSDNQAASQSS